MSKINNPEWSYSKQKESENVNFEKTNLPSCYSSPNSIDAWRHQRMYESICPLLNYYEKVSCLTVGDGSFGSGAYFLSKYSDDILATSLNTNKLAVAKEKGYIKKFKAENAEKIDQPDNAFDIVLCKEAYHHFPRPSIGFYEMLRVAKKAVVLIEPHESSAKLLDPFKNMIKKILRKDSSSLFEPSGNYIYRINPREIEKNLIAMNFEYLAYKKMNDFFHAGISPTQKGNNKNTWITILAIKVQDALSYLKIINYGLVSLVAFKESPSSDLIQALKKEGFIIKKLPKNPYV